MEYVNEQTPYNDPCMREYVLRVKVKIVRANAQQGMKGGLSEFNAAILIPLEGDQTNRFYSAWLPDDSSEHTETVLSFGHPVYGTCRVAVLRSGKFYSSPHLFVMSKGVEDALSKCDGLILEGIKVLSAADDVAADAAVETDVEIDKYKWD